MRMFMCMQGPISKWNDPAESSESEDDFEPPVDAEAAAQAHINALAGACLALGIKYAGTCHAAARDLLHNYVLYFLSAKQGAPDPVSGQTAAGKLIPSPPAMTSMASGCLRAVASCLPSRQP